MRNQPLVPCLWFDDQAQAAARFYTQSFPDSRVTNVSHYPASIDNPSGKPRASVLTVELEIQGQRFTALNGGPHFDRGQMHAGWREHRSVSDVRRCAASQG